MTDTNQTSMDKEKVIRAAFDEMYERGYKASSKYYAELFEAAHMDDAAMMVRASEATRQNLLNANSNVQERTEL